MNIRTLATAVMLATVKDANDNKYDNNSRDANDSKDAIKGTVA
jgi:hypothetical protein